MADLKALTAKVRVGEKVSSSLNPKGFPMYPSQLEPAAYVGQLAGFAPFSAASDCRRKNRQTDCQSRHGGGNRLYFGLGVWSQRDSFQMLEMAVLRWLAGQSIPHRPQALPFLHNLEARLPTQTVRSEEQVEHQHFSTPLGLAWLAAHLADIQPDDVVLEPSAGTGMLAVWARHAAASPQRDRSRPPGNPAPHVPRCECDRP
jgi:hypothetical protein